jgi:hypothetical protein
LTLTSHTNEKISKKSAYLKNPIVGDYFVGTDSENNGKNGQFWF